MRTRAMVLLALVAALSPARAEGLDWTLVKEAIRRAHPEVRHLSTGELARDLQDEHPPLLVDVRTREEYEVSHLARAVRADEALLEALEEGPKDRFVVLYCSVGARSAAAAERLQESGLTRVFNLEGSIFQWANEGRPVYSREGRVHLVHPYDRLWGRLLREDLRAPLEAP